MIDFIHVDFQRKSIFEYVATIRANDGKLLGYKVRENIGYFSERYNKWVIAEKGDRSDGATNAPDIDSFGWLFHDVLCSEGVFSDGSKCTNWQASSILSDILKAEGRWFRARSWFITTWLFGGGKARKNGLV